MSVIVPVYNVEDYLEECLRSLVGQNFRDLEVVVIDDGATDGSAAIARRMQLRHPHKIRYFRQENAGLGAARNAGVERARGQYLMFVDSDDTLPRTAVRRMVETIEETGSDFVCGAMQRVENGVKRLPRWVRDLHGFTDLKTTIRDRPDMIMDVFACNKLFNREFWNRAGIEFPVGVYYEDQIPSIKTYLSTSSFDVLPDIVYRWRIRTGDQSITQTTAEIKNLRDRAYVTGEVNRILLQDGSAELRRYWLDSRILGNDISLYLKDVDWTSDEYYTEIRNWLTAIFDEDDWRLAMRTAAVKRLLAWAVCHKDRSVVEQLRAYERLNAGGAPHRVADGHLRVVLSDELEEQFAEAPAELFRLEGEDLRLTTSLRNLSWQGSILRIGGWAYLGNIDLAEHATEITVEIRDADARVLASATAAPAPEYCVTRRGANRWADYDAAGFRAELDVAGLVADGTVDGSQVWVTVRTAGFTQSGRIDAPVANGGGKWPVASGLIDGARVQPQWRDHALRLDLKPVPLVVSELRAEHGDVILTGTGQVDGVKLTKTDGLRKSITAEVTSQGDDLQIRLPGAVQFLQEGRERKVRALAPEPSMIALDDALPDLLVLGSVVALRSRAGNLVLDRTRPRLIIDTQQVEGTTWRVSGQSIDVDPRRLRLEGTRHSLEPNRVTSADDGTFTAEFELEVAEWGATPRPLPPGLYKLAAEQLEDGERAQVRWSLTASLEIPAEFVDDRYSVRSTKNEVPVLEVLADVGGDAMGALGQRRLQDEVYQPARRGPRTEAVLFESFHGRNVTCNPSAIWQELVRRGSTLTMYWSVNDSSVSAPAGTIPLVRLSREWYRVLGEAKYLVNNSNFPSFFQQADDQVYLQTWHGTPLKKIGHDIGRVLFSYRNYLEMMDREAAGWDALISPNSFCTELFPHAFAFHGTIVESGYPRNDVLVNDPDGAADRARGILGLQDDPRKVLLYAPTWRDDQFDGRPGRYRSVYHLDFDDFAEELGEEYLVLVRGHSNTLLYGQGVRTDNVIDVTRYPEVNELYALADVLVTDYSSVMFDYSVTGKPLLFLAPDIADYRDRVRGFYFDFEATSPGPILSDTAELVSALRRLPEVSDEYAGRYEAFRHRFNRWEDGQATRRVVERVFAEKGGVATTGA